MVDFTRPFPNKNPGDEITKQELISAIRLALCAEEEAIHLYDSIAEYSSDDRVKKIMKDVADEEQVHVGEFQKLLDLIEDDEVEKVEQGEEEAEEKMNEDISPNLIARYLTDDPDVINENISAGAHIDFDYEDAAEFIGRIIPDAPEGHEGDIGLFEKASHMLDPNCYPTMHNGGYRIMFEFYNDAKDFIDKLGKLGLKVDI